MVFRALFDRAPVAMIALATDGVIERANAVMAELVGCPSNELEARHITEIAPDLELRSLDAAVRTLRDGTAERASFESGLAGEPGTDRSIRITISPIYDESNRILSLLAYVEDMTREHHERAARIANEERLRAALDASEDAFMLLASVGSAAEPDFEILDVNVRAEILFGGERDALVGARLSSITVPEVMAALMPTYVRVMETCDPADEDVEISQADSTFVLHQEVVAAGSGIAVMCRDVSEVRLDERNRRRDERIAEAIFDGSPIGIQLFDATGNSARMNEAQRQLLGLPSTSYGVADFNILADRLTAITGEAAAFRRAYAGETVEEFEYTVDMGSSDNAWATRADSLTIARAIFPLRGDSGEVTGGVSFSRDVTVRADLERNLEFLAYHDPLTQLANRKILNDRLTQALASRRRSLIAIAMVDLDGFKQINDTLGHGAGDRLLQHVAACLTVAVREGDTVARVGGDEFAVMLDDLEGMADAEVVAGRLLAELGTPISIDGVEVRARASIGVALVERGADPAAALRAADAAMYAAKTAGKGRVTIRPELVSRSKASRPSRPPRLRSA